MSYIYNISSNFLNGLDRNELFSTITKNNNISKQLNNIMLINNKTSISINFNESLSIDELAELNLIISNHNINNFIKFSHKEVMPINKIFNTNVYELVCRFCYDGDYHKLKKIRIISRIDPQITNFSFKLNDNNNNILCEKTFQNNNSDVYDILSFNNIQETECLFEFYIKINNPGFNFTLDSLTFYYL